MKRAFVLVLAGLSSCATYHSAPLPGMEPVVAPLFRHHKPALLCGFVMPERLVRLRVTAALASSGAPHPPRTLELP